MDSVNSDFSQNPNKNKENIKDFSNLNLNSNSNFQNNKASVFVNTEGYFNYLKVIFKNPRDFYNNLPKNIYSSLIFIFINMTIMAFTVFFTQIIGYSLNKIDLSGDLFGSIIKGMFFSSFYSLIFLFSLAGIILLLCVLKKKNINFGQSFALSSVFSINFLTVALGAFFALFISLNSDITKIILLVNSIFSSAILIYSSIIIIQGINNITDLSVFKAAFFYISLVLIWVFISGELIENFNQHFLLSFGNFGQVETPNVIEDLNTFENMIKDFNF